MVGLCIISYQRLEESGGHKRGFFLGAGEKLPQPKGCKWALALRARTVSCACFVHPAHLHELSPGAEPHSYFLLLTCQQDPDFVWAAMCRDLEKRSSLIQASSASLFSSASDWPTQKGPGPVPLMRRDGKSAGERFSPAKEGTEKSLFAYLPCPLLWTLSWLPVMER